MSYGARTSESILGRALVPAAVLAGLLQVCALRAETVQGYVINPIDGTRIHNAEVVFFVSQDGQVSEILRKPTDAQGRFAFSGPFLTPDLNFVLMALYQEVPYPSSKLQVGAQKEIILEVYDPTTADSQIRIATCTLFLSLRPRGLEVAQSVQADNRGEKTYVGRNQGKVRQVMEFALPAGVFNLSGSLKPGRDSRFYNNRPLPPGLSQILFNFQLDPRQLDGGYLHQVLYPTDRLEVFLQPTSLQLGPPFEDLGTADFHGESYRHLQLQNLKRGQTVLIPFPLPQPWRWVLKWIALSAAALSGTLALVFRRMTTAAAVEPDPEELRQQRSQLLQQLARLDDAHADHRDDRRYLVERARLMDQALNVYRLLEQQDEPTRL